MEEVAILSGEYLPCHHSSLECQGAFGSGIAVGHEVAIRTGVGRMTFDTLANIGLLALIPLFVWALIDEVRG